MDVSNLKNAAAQEAYTHSYVKTTLDAANPKTNSFLKVNPGDKLIDTTALRQSVETMFNLAPTAPERLLDIKNA